METQQQKERTAPQCRPEQLAGGASSFLEILFIHPSAILALHPSTEGWSMCKTILRKWGRVKVCVHMCKGLRVTASCWGQSLHLSASLPEPVESLQGRLATINGHTFSGVTKAKCSLLAGTLMIPLIVILKQSHLCWTERWRQLKEPL